MENIQVFALSALQQKFSAFSLISQEEFYNPPGAFIGRFMNLHKENGGVSRLTNLKKAHKTAVFLARETWIMFNMVIKKYLKGQLVCN